MKQKVAVGVLLAVLVALALPVSAQQGTTEVRGRVVDPQGAVLPGVTVTVRNQDTGMFRETRQRRRTARSSPAASFPGTYEVVAELQGFKKFDRRDLALEVGKTATIDVTLEVGGIERDGDRQRASRRSST